MLWGYSFPLKPPTAQIAKKTRGINFLHEKKKKIHFRHSTRPSPLRHYMPPKNTFFIHTQLLKGATHTQLGQVQCLFRKAKGCAWKPSNEVSPLSEPLCSGQRSNETVINLFPRTRFPLQQWRSLSACYRPSSYQLVTFASMTLFISG